MDLTIASTALAEELALLERVTPRKPAIPVLTHAHLVAGDSVITMFATDARVGMRTRCEAQVDTQGEVLLPVKKTAELVRSLSGHAVHLRADNGSVRLETAMYKSSLQSQAVADFPQMPEREVDSLPRSIKADTLRTLVKRTRYAVGTHEDPRGMITAALLECDGKLARMVGTDGHRLACTETQLDTEGAPLSCLLSPFMLDALMPVLEDRGEGPVDVEVSGVHAFVSAGDRLVFGQLVAGNFPAWQRIIPKSFPGGIDVDREPLLAALRRARLVGQAERVVFTFEKDTMRVSASSVTVGSGDEVLPVRYAGDPVTVAINVGYALDFLGEVSATSVRVEFKDDSFPVLFRANDPVYDSLTIIMPIRL